MKVKYKGHEIYPGVPGGLVSHFVKGPLVDGGAGSIASCKQMVDNAEYRRTAHCAECKTQGLARIPIGATTAHARELCSNCLKVWRREMGID